MSTGGEIPRELAEAVLGLLFGVPGVVEKIQSKAAADLEAKLVGPARRYRQTQGTPQPYAFGPEAQDYVAQVLAAGPGPTTGLVFAMLEPLVQASMQADAAPDPDRPAEPDGLDWAVLRADRNRLAERLARAERLREKAERERNVWAANVDRLNDEVIEKSRRIRELEALVQRVDAENVELHGRLQDAGEALMATTDGDPR
jgi:hypothetical protein